VVTTTLISKGATEIRTLREGIDKGLTFCASSVMVPGLIAQYPDLALLLVDSPNGGSLAAMDAGVCYGAIVQIDAWRAARLFDDQTHCKTKARLPETVAIVANTFPMRGEIERFISAAITRNVRYAWTPIRQPLAHSHTPFAPAHPHAPRPRRCSVRSPV